MNSTNKESPGVRGIRQPFNRQARHTPPSNSGAAQLQTVVSAQSVKRPVAPPVYRPQARPNAVQSKRANGAVNRKLPVAPPVYRPQQFAKVLQTKSSLAQNSKAGQVPRRPVAPPVYRPEIKKIVRPKAISPQRNSPTAPPVCRPQQRIAQPKMAPGGPARTRPTAPPVRRTGLGPGTAIPPGRGVVQRVLAVTNLEEKSQASQHLVDFINTTIFRGKYKLDLVPDNNLHLLKLEAGVNKEIDPSGERFYLMLERMINSKHFAYVRLAEASSKFAIAHFDNQAIDVRDVSAFGAPNMKGSNAAGLLIHELWEQYNAQVGKLSYEQAHAKGIEAENYVQGSVRIFDYPRKVSSKPLEQEREDVLVHLYPDGQIVISRIHIADAQVVSVQRTDATERIMGYLKEKQVQTDILQTALEKIARESPSELMKVCELAIKDAQ